MLKPFLTKWPFLFKFRLFLGVVLVIISGIFLYLKIVPFGHISYTRVWPRGLASGRGFIYDFKPAENLLTADTKMTGENKPGLRIVAEPIYFSLFTPRRFDQATVTVKYYDHVGEMTPLIEAGVLKDKISDSYEFKPLQNDILDDLRFTWPRLEDTAERLILQATKNYSDPQKFIADLESGRLQDCPPGNARACVALYNYTWPLNDRWPDYQPLSPLTISQPLRGAHQFYVYFSGPWRLGFSFTDLNQDQAADPITVNIWHQNEILESQTLVDDNVAPTSGRTENKELVLTGQDNDAGIYRVDIKVSDDIVIAKINSSSNRLVFINKIWPVSGAGNQPIFTDIVNLEAQTFSPASLQTIVFGEQKFILDETYRRYTFFGGAGIKEIKLVKDDVILAGNGVFGFSADLFNPDFKRMDQYFSPGEEVKYIIAAYERPLIDQGLKTAQAEFVLNDAYRENGKYTFSIVVPGLSLSDGIEDYLEIKEIKVELEGKSLVRKIREILDREE